MPVQVRIPTPLRSMTKGQDVVQAEGATLAQVIDHLEKSYGGLKSKVCDEQGEIRRYVRVFVNDEDVRMLKGSQTALKAGDTVSIVPAIAGG